MRLTKIGAGIVGCLLALAFAAPAQARVIVSLEFDDQGATQLQLGPMLAARRLHATFFVNSGLIGRPGSMTAADLLALQAQGNEIAGHTIDHVELPGLPADKQSEEICADRNRLGAMGFEVTDFAYPVGSYSPLTEEIVASCGYESARTVGGVACLGCGRSESLPPLDRFATRTVDAVDQFTTPGQLKRVVNRVNRGKRVSWLQIVFHDVCEVCSNVSVSRDTLVAFLDWLRPRGRDRRVLVLTVRQALAHSSENIVAAP